MIELPPHIKVVVRVKRRRPLTWTLGLLIYREGRWVFRPWTLHACATGHFEYCRRRDRTRNIIVEGTYCVPVEPPECVGPRWKCEPLLFAELEDKLQEAFRMAEEELLAECFACFGLTPEETGHHIELEDISVCRYNRCEQPPVWRTSVGECRFVREGR